MLGLLMCGATIRKKKEKWMLQKEDRDILVCQNTCLQEWEDLSTSSDESFWKFNLKNIRTLFAITV